MNILVKTYAGSHLFGTNTPESDTDYKGIYIPTAEEILLGNYKETRQYTTGDLHGKNSKEDIDVELYSLTKFFKMLKNGDTAAIELLFTPENLIVEKSPLWDDIVTVRDQLVSKKINGIIGYARHQANKYGTKGVRLGDLGKVIEEFKRLEKTLDFDNPKLKHAWDEIVSNLGHLEHVEFIKLTPNAAALEDVPAIDILGIKFDHHTGFSYVLESLKKTFKAYGRRAREAKNDGGVDFKALSHAARVSIQGVELLRTGKITLPLNDFNRKLVRKIKLGELESRHISDIIEEQLDLLEELAKTSELRDVIDEEFVNEIIVRIYKGVINE